MFDITFFIPFIYNTSLLRYVIKFCGLKIIITNFPSVNTSTTICIVVDIQFASTSNKDLFVNYYRHLQRNYGTLKPVRHRLLWFCRRFDPNVNVIAQGSCSLSYDVIKLTVIWLYQSTQSAGFSTHVEHIKKTRECHLIVISSFLYMQCSSRGLKSVVFKRKILNFKNITVNIFMNNQWFCIIS